METPRISVVIHTLNEEHHLPAALRSVAPWADEIVVVDMHSDDGTVAIAASFGARVLSHARAGFVEPARAFGIAHATHPWVLILDADELIPAPLAAALREIAREDRGDVVAIHRLNYLHGRPLRRAGWQPELDRHFRFFKQGSLRASDMIHAPLVPAAGARILILPYEPGRAIVHFNFLDFADLLEKVNRYTTVEATQAHERGERSTPWDALRALRPFWWRYVRTRGYRDGWRGWYLALFMAFYAVAKYAKLRERERIGDRERIVALQEREAERWLAAYERTTPDAG